MTHRLSGLTKFQLKLLQMESGALNQGLNRTQLTPDRLSLALSVMLTKQVCNILYKSTVYVSLFRMSFDVDDGLLLCKI